MRSSLVAVLVLSMAGIVHAGPPVVIINPIVFEGFNVPGIGLISGGFAASERHAVNDHGDWLVRADTTHADTNADLVVLNGNGHSTGSLLLRENQLMTAPAGARLSTPDSMYINNHGNMSFNHFLRDTGSTNNDSGVYFNNDLLIQESNHVTAAGISANSPWLGFFETRINNSNTVMVMGTCDDPAIASGVDQLFVLVNPFTLAQTLVAREGSEIVSGRFVETFGTGTHTMALNDHGHVMFTVDMTGATTDDGAVVIWDGTNYNVVMREGDASPVAGRNWQSTPTAVDFNSNGDWVARGDLDGATTDDSVIVKNGTDIIAREGHGLPAIGSFLFQNFGTGGVAIDKNGNVVWYGDWDDPDTTRDKGLFWNDQLIVQIGVTQVQDGRIITSISAVSENISLSGNGRWLVFEGVLNDGTDGAFMVEIIPEPGTLALLALGLTAVIRRRRR